MHRGINLQDIFLLLALFSVPALAAPPESRPMSFNVRDFGAHGDGRTDDTKAIQTTFDAAAKKTWSEQPPGSAYFISIPTVFIPAGKYLITETIDLKANVSGEGTAIVEQKNAEKDVFSSTFAWRLQVSGLTLVGGQHQLHIGNPNVDTGRITIEKCAFYNARGTAIRLRQGSNSTQVSVRDGVFYNCNQALVNWCDLTSVADCWISSAQEMKDRAVIENHGVLTLAEHLRRAGGQRGERPTLDRQPRHA